VSTALEQGPGLQTLPTLFSASFHNDSINFFPVLLEYLVSLPSGYWNPVSSIWFGALAWAVTLGLATGLCCRQVSHPLARLTIVALGCLIGFSPSFRFLVPFGIHRVLPMACCIGIAALLSRPGLGWRRLLLCLVLALVATFSFANGFLAFAVLWIALALRRDGPNGVERSIGVGGPAGVPRRFGRRSMVLVAALLTALTLVLFGLRFDPSHQQDQALLHGRDYQPAKILDGFSTWVSSPLDRITANAQQIFDQLGPDKWLVQNLAISLGLLTAAGFLITWRRSHSHRSGAGVFLPALLGGLFLPMTLLLARYRSVGFNDERYLCEITLLSLLITTALFSAASPRPGADGLMGLPLIAALLMFGAIALMPLTWTSGYFQTMGSNVPIKLRLVEHCIRASDPTTTDLWSRCAVEQIAPDRVAKETFQMLERRGYWRRLRDGGRGSGG
jgi:hypothetical protein